MEKTRVRTDCCPVRGDGDGDNILIDAVEGNQKRGSHHDVVKVHQIPVVSQQTDCDKEPKHILHRCPPAGHGDGEERTDDKHQCERDPHEKENRRVERVGPNEAGTGCAHPVPDQPQNGKQQERLVPEGGDHWDGEHVAEHVIHQAVEGQNREQYAADAPLKHTAQ